MADVAVLTFITDMELSEAEIPYWRGAVIKMTGYGDILFHDHDGTSYRYAYPQIQYKVIDGKAAIVAIAEGAEHAGLIFCGLQDKVRVGYRETFVHVSDMKHSVTDVSVDNSLYVYALSRWLPLNQENYRKYVELDGLGERCGMLERLLVGNILSFAKGLGIIFDKKVNVEILDINNQKQCEYKGVMMLGMNIVFRTNVRLPQYVGLGKGVSLGFGTITEKQ